MRRLFTIPYKYGSSTIFLVDIDAGADAVLVYDPEEVEAAHRKLVAVAWQPIAGMQENPEVKHLLRVLNDE